MAAPPNTATVAALPKFANLTDLASTQVMVVLIYYCSFKKQLAVDFDFSRLEERFCFPPMIGLRPPTTC
jgi:hypothetical protein